MYFCIASFPWVTFCIGCCLHHRSPLRWKDAVTWLAYPGVYLVYILARGAVSGLYPYPFVDVNELGYAGVFTRAGIFLLVFLGMGLLVVAVARWTRRRPAA